MRIRFTTSIAGSFGGYAAGDVADLPDADALGLIRAGQAVHDDTDADAIETATAAPAVAETATRKFSRVA